MITSTNKKTKKKWIYIGAGIAIFILIAGVGFWFWNKSKNKSDSTEEQDSYKDSPVDIKEWRSREWVNKDSGYSNYRIPPLPKNISESQAKEEIIELMWHKGGKNWDKKKIERFLEKAVKQVNPADIKKYGKFPFAEFIEKEGEKYQSEIFFNPPDQGKFESGIRENQWELFFITYVAFCLKRKNNKEFDWKASLNFSEENKLKKREELEEINLKIEGEIYPTLAEQAKKFPHLTTLAELNKWSKALARKQEAVERLICYRYHLAERVKEKVPSPLNSSLIKDSKLKNKKFGLEPVLNYHKLREE